ncbi:transposase [Synechococcus sp. PCC 6716]|nr:transposase [Synechococcus sp. PCC 6716]
MPTRAASLSHSVVTVAVPPQCTSQTCSCCGHLVKTSLSTCPHLCQCGTVLDRDPNAAISIVELG